MKPAATPGRIGGEEEVDFDNAAHLWLRFFTIRARATASGQDGHRLPVQFIARAGRPTPRLIKSCLVLLANASGGGDEEVAEIIWR